jgi:hypothetical protein
MFGVRNVSDYAVDHSISAGDKWFLNKSHARIVKHPHAVMFVRRDGGYCVHLQTSTKAFSGKFLFPNQQASCIG